MNPFHRYQAHGHRERPWWYRIETQSSSGMCKLSSVFHYRRADSICTGEFQWNRRMNDEENAEQEAAILHALELLDREKPLERPGPAVGQVWGYWVGGFPEWIECVVDKVTWSQEGEPFMVRLSGQDHGSDDHDQFFGNKILLDGPGAPWAPGDWRPDAR